MPLPPVGVKFRIVSVPNGYILGGPIQEWYSKKYDRAVLNTSSPRNNYDYYDMTWWTIDDGHTINNAECVYYHLTNVGLGKNMYANWGEKNTWTENGELGVTSGSGWKIEFEIKIDQYDEFELWNYSKMHDMMVRVFLLDHPYSKKHPNYAGLVDAYGEPTQSTERFKFFYEQCFIESMGFDVEDGQMLAQTPLLVAEQTFINHTSTEQTQQFIVQYTETQEHRYSYTSGFKITTEMSVTLTAKIPMFGEESNTFSLGEEVSETWTEETITTESKSMRVDFPITVPPGKTVVSKAFITEEIGEVPYTAVLRFKSSNKTALTYGKWHGVQCVKIYNKLEEI